MPQDFSFDVVSKVDLQEVANAVQQASKEIATRFDFRGSVSKIEWDEKELTLTLTSEDTGKLKSVVDILETRLVKRGIAVKSLEYGKIEDAAGGSGKGRLGGPPAQPHQVRGEDHVGVAVQRVASGRLGVEHVQADT